MPRTKNRNDDSDDEFVRKRRKLDNDDDDDNSHSPSPFNTYTTATATTSNSNSNSHIPIITAASTSASDDEISIVQILHDIFPSFPLSVINLLIEYDICYRCTNCPYVLDNENPPMDEHNLDGLKECITDLIDGTSQLTKGRSGKIIIETGLICPECEDDSMLVKLEADIEFTMLTDWTCEIGEIVSIENVRVIEPYHKEGYEATTAAIKMTMITTMTMMTKMTRMKMIMTTRMTRMRNFGRVNRYELREEFFNNSFLLIFFLLLIILFSLLLSS